MNGNGAGLGPGIRGKSHGQGLEMAEAHPRPESEYPRRKGRHSRGRVSSIEEAFRLLDEGLER